MFFKVFEHSSLIWSQSVRLCAEFKITKVLLCSLFYLILLFRLFWWLWYGRSFLLLLFTFAFLWSFTFSRLLLFFWRSWDCWDWRGLNWDLLLLGPFLNEFNLIEASDVVNVITDSHGKGALLCLVIFLTLSNLVLGNLSWKSLDQLSLVRVVDDQIKVTLLVVKSNCLCGWERRSNLEKLLCHYFFSSFEFVRDANWLKVVLLNLEVSNLEVWRKHSCLKSTSSSDTIRRVQSSRSRHAEAFFDMLNACGDSCGFSNQLN